MTSSLRRDLVANLGAPVMIALTLAGCAFTRPPPVRQMFLLDPALPAAVAKTQDGTLRVGIITVAGPFRDRSLVLRVGELRYETDYYDEFVTPPSPMLAETTSRALSQGRVFAQVAAPGTPAQADYVLDGFVSALYADHRTPGICKAVIAVTFYLSQADAGNGVPFWSKDYQRASPCRDTSAESFVGALNTGLAEILAELASDLAAAKLPAR